MPVFAVFDQAAYYGCCPNVSGTPPSSPLDKGAFRLHADCSCHDASFGGVIDLPALNDDTESFPKARGETRRRCRSSQRWKQPRVPTEQRPPGPQGSVQARLDAFLAGKGASRAGAHATETGAGSGWAWLVASGGRLAVVSTANADTPFVHGQTPLLTIDVWEHAYYIDYRNMRPKYVEAFLDKLVNWTFAEANFA